MYHIWSYLALADHIEIAFDTKTLRQSSYAIDYASGSNKEDTHRWARNLPAYLLSVVLELQAVLLPYRQYSETHDGNLIRCDRSWASILSLRRVMPAGRCESNDYRASLPANLSRGVPRWAVTSQAHTRPAA